MRCDMSPMIKQETVSFLSLFPFLLFASTSPHTMSTAAFLPTQLSSVVSPGPFLANPVLFFQTQCCRCSDGALAGVWPVRAACLLPPIHPSLSFTWASSVPPAPCPPVRTKRKQDRAP